MNNNFLVFGRTKSPSPSLIAASFNSDSGISVILAHLKCRYSFSLSFINCSNAVLVGGSINRTAIRCAELFNFTKKLVVQISPLSFARTCHGACLVENDIIVCGGIDNEHETTSTCEIYLSAERRWRPLPEMRKPRYGLCVISLSRRRVFSIGGCHEGEYFDAFSIVEGCQLPADFNFNPQNYTEGLGKSFWRNLAPMRQGRKDHAATAFREHIIVAGGYKNIKFGLNSVEVFTPPTSDNERGQWCSLQAAMNVPRSDFFLCVSSDEIFSIGGNVRLPSNTSERLQMGTSQTSSWWSSSDSTVQLLKNSTWIPGSSVEIMNSIYGAISMPKHVIRH